MEKSSDKGLPLGRKMGNSSQWHFLLFLVVVGAARLRVRVRRGEGDFRDDTFT